MLNCAHCDGFLGDSVEDWTTGACPHCGHVLVRPDPNAAAEAALLADASAARAEAAADADANKDGEEQVAEEVAREKEAAAQALHNSERGDKA